MEERAPERERERQRERETKAPQSEGARKWGFRHQVAILCVECTYPVAGGPSQSKMAHGYFFGGPRAIYSGAPIPGEAPIIEADSLSSCAPQVFVRKPLSCYLRSPNY